MDTPVLFKKGDKVIFIMDAYIECGHRDNVFIKKGSIKTIFARHFLGCYILKEHKTVYISEHQFIKYSPKEHKTIMFYNKIYKKTCQVFN